MLYQSQIPDKLISLYTYILASEPSYAIAWGCITNKAKKGNVIYHKWMVISRVITKSDWTSGQQHRWKAVTRIMWQLKPSLEQNYKGKPMGAGSVTSQRLYLKLFKNHMV